MVENKQILEKLFDDFYKEKEMIQSKMNDCKEKITEVNTYIHSISAMEDSDFKVFSPRNVESVYKESLEENRKLKEKYEEEYQNLIIKKEKADSRLKRIEILMKNISDDCAYFDILEKDRQRIARDLHDSSLQDLTHIIHKAELASMYIDKDPIQAKLELASVSKSIKEVIEEIRSTIFDLRPMQFDDLGLKEAIEQLLEKSKRDSGLNISYIINENVSSCDKNVLMSVFRIIQECINNAVKHSNGNLIEVAVKNVDDYIDINISDNGDGFQVDEVFSESERRHFGLSIIKERVSILHGTIQIDSKLDKGTIIHIQLPCIR